MHDHSLKTERLSLRILTPKDVSQRYVAWLNNPAVNKFLEVRHSEQTLESVRGFVSGCLKDQTQYLFGVFIADTDEHIGNIKLGPVNTVYKTADIGLLIGEPVHWGKGFASEMIEAVARFAFEDLGLRKITAGCYAQNHGSLNAFLKCGFQREGVLRGQVLCDGNPDDVFLLGLLKNDKARH